jgi:very-short-patch-repair endonuclease
VKENNYWDDIPTAVILFMEETNKEVWKTPDIYQQLNHIFWDKIWWEIKDIWFPDSTWSGIKQLSLELPGEWMIQIFWLFLKENRQKLQDKQHEDSQRLDRKFWHLERIIILLLSMWIQVIQKPEKLFEYVLLWDIRHQHVEYLCEIFSIYECEIDIETEYDKIIETIIRYLRDRDKSIITRFLWRKEIEIPDDEFSKDDTKDDILKERKKRRGPCKKEYTKWWLKVTYTAQHSKIHDTITQASFAWDTAFLDICKEILNWPEKYDKETYANIIINWHNLEGNYDERLLTKAIIELKLRPWELSLETMCKLFQSISKWVYDNSQVWNILNTCKLTIAWSVFDHIWESDASNLIYALSFLREFHQAQGILETFINRNKIIGISFDTPISIHHTLYWLFEYRDTLCAKKLIIKLFEAAVKLDSFSNINAKWFAQVFNIYDRPTPPALDFALKHAITHTLPPNRWEENTAKLFGRYFHKVLTGQYIGGFECDIILPEQKVNIEFDWVQYHEGWDRERWERRDAYLEKNGWKVYRIRSDEDINRRVHEIVAEISKNRA